MIRVLFILSTVLALQTGVARAAETAKPLCVCGDSCACKPGDCPGRCPVKAKGNANDAWASKADAVVLCIGVPAIEGAYATGPKAGFENGVYDFRKDASGVYRGHLRQAVSACANGRCYPASVYGFANPKTAFDAPSCASGQCQSPATVRRR